MCKGDVTHFEDLSLTSESDFEVTQTFTVKSKTHCSTKCSMKKNKCSAYIYNDETQECKLGKIHPKDVTCDGEIQKISNL